MMINRSSLRNLFYKTRYLFSSHANSQIEGKPIISPIRMGKGLEKYWNRSWKTEVIARFCKADDAAFIDIGANLGQTLFDHYLADAENQYVGFEPNPRCIYYLNDLIEQNSFSRHTILPIGLAEQAKIVPLYSRKGNADDDSATLIKDLRPTWELASQYVPCYQFDEVRETLRLERISLIKIDVEGFELEVLKGMQTSISACQPVILCEVLFRDPSAEPSAHQKRNEELIELLSSFNYSILQLVKSKDDLRVTDARKITAFDTESFSEENRQLCDYLFFPAGEESRIKNLLFKNQA